MTREELILKWLDHDLNARELEAFKALDDYDELSQLDGSIKRFKAPDYDKEEARQALLSAIQTNKKARSPWLSYAWRVAAVLVIGLSAFWFYLGQDTTISTLVAEKTSVHLPDQSEVILNAQSTLEYNKRNWKDARDIELDGEAFFKVAKGKSFTVSTSSGDVTVLGTEFNVKNRSGIFEVVCYEGSVQVTTIDKDNTLKAGDRFLVLDGNYIASEKELTSNPSWIKNESYFKSMPYQQVIQEFERQYDVSLVAESVDMDQRFTGSFTHDDIDLALKSITLPLNLKYRQSDSRTIMLSSE